MKTLLSSILVLCTAVAYAMTAHGNSSDDGYIPMEQRTYRLKGITVESSKKPILHLVAYVRDYSRLTSYSDTVTMFREKIVDFMLPAKEKKSYPRWTLPRVLTSKSYYHFTNYTGLDSVSNRSRYHFSWADWISPILNGAIPHATDDSGQYNDTIQGRYGPVEIWSSEYDNHRLTVNVLADSMARRRVPSVDRFLRDGTDFECFEITYELRDVVSEYIEPQNLHTIVYDIDSRGRGYDMFMFNRVDEPCFVESHIEVYFIDKKYLSKKEASRYENSRQATLASLSMNQDVAPELPKATKELIAKVEMIDHTEKRLDFTPDPRLAAKHKPDYSFKARMRSMINSLVKSKK